LRIVIRAKDARRARDAQARVAAAGFEAAALSGPYRGAPDGEDLSIYADDWDEVLHRPGLAQLSAASLEREPNAINPVVALDAPAPMLKQQISAAIRLGLAEDELYRRNATAAALGHGPPATKSFGPLSTLYVGAPSAAFLSLEHMLADKGGAVTGALSSQSGFDHLHDETFDGIILNAADKPEAALSLCSTLRRNPVLHDLPTLALVRPGDHATTKAMIARGACAVWDTAAAPHAPLGWLLEAVRRDRRRRAAEWALRALRDRMGEARTGLWTLHAFTAHLARLADDHYASGRQLGLVAMRVLPAHGALAPRLSFWEKGFAEVSSIAGRLSRETDCACAVRNDAIVVAMPASGLAAARRAAKRIASVAECTAFVSGDLGSCPLILEQSAVELQPGESGRGLMARALRAIDAEPTLASS
jgi:two-component system cell cycle response regulator PopA